jgi:hypothetical protein
MNGALMNFVHCISTCVFVCHIPYWSKTSLTFYKISECYPCGNLRSYRLQIVFMKIVVWFRTNTFQTYVAIISLMT